LAVEGVRVTQQYIVGELSIRIAALCPVACSPLAVTVQELRRQIEQAPFSALAPLVLRAIDVADLACWTSLEQGDMEWFRRESAGAADLREFAVCAGVLPVTSDGLRTTD
jgi:hypothetical protein